MTVFGVRGVICFFKLQISTFVLISLEIFSELKAKWISDTAKCGSLIFIAVHSGSWVNGQSFVIDRLLLLLLIHGWKAKPKNIGLEQIRAHGALKYKSVLLCTGYVML